MNDHSSRDDGSDDWTDGPRGNADDGVPSPQDRDGNHDLTGGSEAPPVTEPTATDPSAAEAPVSEPTAPGPPLIELPESEPRDAEPTVPLEGVGPRSPWAPPVAPSSGPAGTPGWLAQAPPAEAPGRPGGPASWMWPAVAAVALVVGLAGGALGGALYEGLRLGGTGLDPASTRTAPPLDAGNQSVSAVADELLPSTVQVLAGGPGAGATGSGFVLDDQGHVVTNQHVVAGSSEDDLRIVDFEGRVYEASVVGVSQVYDIAVLDVDGADELRAASLGASRSLLVGDPVVAFGAPLGLSQTVTSGIVSALNRPVTTGESDDETSFINAVQTDAAINPGNSGGPLVNLEGQVVGVNSAIATTGGMLREAGNIGVGFAIPIEQVRTTADQILRTGEARYPVIGATVQTGGDRDNLGARIDEVLDGTPAERAGLRVDDLVTEVDGDRVADGIALIVAIRTHRPGDTLDLTVMRDGEERRVSITLDSEVG
ncbi:S1C family serine protease [Nocardioides campestrisoli]|uniref:S1C family serine protease n=1 Tax=Nocardioides campestrisoli TaxID=2736757 RepID=UPI00163DB6F6|nr:trypsin-like peptidase domain-containing protein [Nocardioides campestrisoli]